MKYALVFLALLGLGFCDRPIVETKNGKIEGALATNENGKTYYSFKGIPFAQPPIGKLRWQRPHPVTSWKDVRDGSKEGSDCKHFDIFFTKETLGEEDCLYLNVYVPEKPESLEGNEKSVMVFIHGGGFISGSGSENLFGPGKLMDHDVILVTINYRLGLYGFLSTGDDMLPGNYGLWDQNEALKWVQKNIKAFGGDPEKVTIFGESAGAASVSYQVLSERSKGLFHKAIHESGSATAPWAMQKNALGHAKAIAEKVGCPTGSTLEIRKCLQFKSTDELFKAYMEYCFSGKPDFEMTFVPIVEQKDDWSFLDENPTEIINKQKYNKVPVISGVMENEAALFNTMIAQQAGALDKNYFDKQFENFGRAFNLEGNPEITNVLKQGYFSKVTDWDDASQTLQPLNNFVSDSMFTFPSVSFANQLVINGNPDVYFYLMSYRGKTSLTDIHNATEDFGPTHADELQYLFDCGYFGKKTLEGKDVEFAKQLLTIWTDFAKSGEPLPNSEWKPVTKESFNYLDLGSSLVMKKDYEPERMGIWSTVLPNTIAKIMKEKKQEL